MIWPFLSPPPAVFHMPSVEMLWIVRNRSADIAMDRVRSIVRIDRQACGDGKWVKVKDRVLCAVPWQTRLSTNPIVQEFVRHWDRQDKARYRWERRR